MRFWPVLMPFLVYALWMLKMRGRARKAGEPLPRFRDGPWFWAVVATFGVAIAMFIVFGVSAREGIRGDYTPPHMENGKIIPGHVAP